MRTLKIIVDGQNIALDPTCDISGLVPGTSGYIQAEFVFSSEWDGCAKVVAFYSNLGRELDAQELKNGKVCTISAEVLKNSIFKLRVFGKKPDFNIRTNRLIICQTGGRA